MCSIRVLERALYCKYNWILGYSVLNKFKIGAMVQYLVFYGARLLRGMASALNIRGAVACSDWVSPIAIAQ